MPTCIQCGAKVEAGVASCGACGLPMPATALAPGEASGAFSESEPPPAAPAAPEDASATPTELTNPSPPAAPDPPQAPPAAPATPAPPAAPSPPDGDAAEGTGGPNTLLRNVLVGVGAVALLTVLVWAYLAFAAGVGVPDLSGRTKAQALTELAAVELQLGRVAYDQSAQGAQGAVIAQDPKAGAKLHEGEPVSVTIAGPPPAVTPDLTGLAEAAAASLLTSAGLEPGERTETYSETVVKGAVCSQDPSVGAEAPRGSAVAMVISKGQQPVPVPSVVKKSLTDAQSVLEAAGFTVKPVQANSDAKKNIVLSQSPAGGSMAQPGARVRLTVSSGVVMVTVPNAVSAALNHAYSGSADLVSEASAVVRGVLSRAGLRTKLVLHPSYETNYQSPRAGARVPRGSTVTVHLAIGD